MRHHEEHLARMNRSGQRGGAVGSKPTACTATLLDWAWQGRINRHTVVFDFGAGKRAAQAAIIREKVGCTVIPYDIGANGHGTTLADIGRSDVVLLSNVLNVQDSMESVRELLGDISRNAEPGTALICNLPREPRYGYMTPHLVTAALIEAGFTAIEHNGYGSGTIWTASK